MVVDPIIGIIVEHMNGRRRGKWNTLDLILGKLTSMEKEQKRQSEVLDQHTQKMDPT